MTDLPTIIRRGAFAAAVLAAAVTLISDTYRPILLGGAGIAQGALIAAIALGVLLTYRGSGVVNLANAVIATYVAFTYAVLRADGDLFLPPLPNPLAPIEGVVHWFQDDNSFDLPDWPTTISFGPNMQFWPALLLSLLFCVILGLILHYLIFRPLRTAPPLAKVVASVGVLLYLQAVLVRRFATTPRGVNPMPFVDKTSVDLGVTTLTQEQLFVALFVIATAGGLWFLFSRTQFGLATRAAAENEQGSIVLGYSPDRLAGINWVMSTLVTGLLGIFVASINATVDPFIIPALIVPALTAALVGGFRSFGLTTLAAFLLGMQAPVITALGVREDWYPKAGATAIPGIETVIPLLIIGIVLFNRGNPLPGRGATESGRLPSAPTPARRELFVTGPVTIALALIAMLFVFTPSYRDGLTNTLIGIIVCLSVVVVTGYVGQISLAPMTFAGISAFAVAQLSDDWGWPFPVPILAGALVATVVGVLLALPALRIRGVNLAIVTLAVALAADRALFANEDVNGGLERAIVATPEVLQQTKTSTWTVLGFLTAGDGKQPNPMTGLFCLFFAALLCYLVANLRRSNTGRHFLSVRSNERAAASSGINVAGTKTLAFAISAFIAGVAGAVIAYRAGNAVQQRFNYQQSLAFFAFAYLGGLSRVSGAVAGGLIVGGGLVFTFLQDALAVPEEFTLLLGGLALIVTAILNPEGIAGGLQQNLDRIRRRQPSPEPSTQEVAA